MPELLLRAKAGVWRFYARRRADKHFSSYRDRVFERDNYTCQFCGFQAREYQEVINLDHNYRNNKLTNLVTVCCFCAQCFFLESVGIGDYGGGTLIYLPEISQANINSLCHVLFCAVTNDTGYKASAQSIYRSLKFRSQVIEQTFGEGASTPAVMGQLLIDTDVEEKSISKKLLKDVRLLPSRAKFRKQIEYWAASALDELSREE
jgi:intracellular multiplication protein IcmJ